MDVGTLQKQGWIDVVALSRNKCGQPIQGLLKYATNENFLGRPVVGYHSNAAEVCLLTSKAALALCEVQNHLNTHFNLGLLIYDAYRPLRAVRDFSLWMQEPPYGNYELERKKIHYPYLEKGKLADLGYIPSATMISRHCYGNAVDVVLISLVDGAEVQMGSVFDYFDKVSHVNASVQIIGEESFKNRTILIDTMTHFGFSVYPEEYWHFDYQERKVEEPKDFEITSSLKGLGV